MNIRDIIREEIQKVLEITIDGHVKCDNCGWEWDIEAEDENPYLCHQCGFDDKKRELDYPALNSWREENNIK